MTQQSRDIASTLDDDLPKLTLPPMSAALCAAVSDPKPVTLRRPLRDLCLFLLLSIPLMTLLISSIGFRRDISDLSFLWLGSVALVWLSSFVAAAYLGFVPAKGHMRPRTQNIYKVVGACCLLLISVGIFATQAPTSQSVTYQVTLANVLSHAPTCSILGISAGVLPGIIALLLMRRFVPVGRWSVGLSLGAAGGSLSGLVLHLHCPINEGFHVGLIHGGSLVISAFLVAGASQVLLRES